MRNLGQQVEPVAWAVADSCGYRSVSFARPRADALASDEDVVPLCDAEAVEAAHRAEVERAVAEEREACAKVCEAISTEAHDMNCPVAARYCGECADAIRARGGA